MSRFEYKYLVSNDDLHKLRSQISPYLELDKYAAKRKNKEYVVRSLYYDTPQLRFYYEKLAGLKNRKKVRIRGYNEFRKNAIAFLEIKRKDTNSIWKNRTGVPFRDISSLLETGQVREFIFCEDKKENGIDDAIKFLFQIHRNSLRPIINVVYEREAFFYKFDHRLRITLDKNLRSSLNPAVESLYREENMIYAIPGNTIMEVKIHGPLPSWLGYTIARLGLRQQALSKYTLALDSHRKKPGTFSILTKPGKNFVKRQKKISTAGEVF
jgi:SPX domain protein involved in polyphosphate accumulation